MYKYVLLCVVFLAACKGGEEEIYPNVITEFATIRTDASGTMTELTTDAGRTFTISNPQSGYDKEVMYRVVCGYVPDGQTAKLYQLTGAYMLHDSTLLAHDPDPIKVTSVWQSGKYINMHLSPLTQGGQQYWGYRIDRLRGRTIHVSLHHRQNDDPLSYTQTVYASLPADDFKTVPFIDSIALHIKTFQGEQVWTFKKP